MQKAPQAHIAAAESTWGAGHSFARLETSRTVDRAFEDWWGPNERLSASPTSADTTVRMSGSVDVRDAMLRIVAPTLILHQAEDAHVPV